LNKERFYSNFDDLEVDGTLLNDKYPTINGEVSYKGKINCAKVV
jgi:hypothetical protein